MVKSTSRTIRQCYYPRSCDITTTIDLEGEGEKKGGVMWCERKGLHSGDGRGVAVVGVGRVRLQVRAGVASRDGGCRRVVLF